MKNENTDEVSIIGHFFPDQNKLITLFLGGIHRKKHKRLLRFELLFSYENRIREKKRSKTANDASGIQEKLE